MIYININDFINNMNNIIIIIINIKNIFKNEIKIKKIDQKNFIL